MKTKYDIGEEVYLMHFNQINVLKVISIAIHKDLTIEYELEHDILRLEKDIYETRAKLIRQL